MREKGYFRFECRGLLQEYRERIMRNDKRSCQSWISQDQLVVRATTEVNLDAVSGNQVASSCKIQQKVHRWDEIRKADNFVVGEPIGECNAAQILSINTRRMRMLLSDKNTNATVTC